MLERARLKSRLSAYSVNTICCACSGHENDSLKEELFAFVGDADFRVSYNALWIFSHFGKRDILWLASKRGILVDLLLHTDNNSIKRLILSLLDRLPMAAEDVTTEYLDFCFGNINSDEPYGIRSLCLKQAFVISRQFPELMHELILEIRMLECRPLSPGLKATLRNISKKTESSSN